MVLTKGSTTIFIDTLFVGRKKEKVMYQLFFRIETLNPLPYRHIYTYIHMLTYV